MNIIYEEKKLCLNCMEIHLVKYVQVEEITTYKNKTIQFFAEYELCDISQSYSENEKQMSKNKHALEEAYQVQIRDLYE